MKIFRLFFSGLLLFLAIALNGQEQKAKYIFLFIGDGMGQAQVNATEAYISALEDEIGFSQMTFTEFPEAGFCSTHSNNRLITGSAAAGTSLATGQKTDINRISMDPEGKQAYLTIAEKCKNKGMKVGIISSASIDHATPAVFYAHQPLRSMYYEIGLDLVNSDIDFFGGGGLKEPVFIVDSINTLNLYDEAVEKGFHYVNDLQGFQQLNKNDGKVMAVSPKLDNAASMPYSIDANPADLSLADFTEKSIELLENENGFFMMIEGGKIDWACHANDAASSIHETIAFDKAVAVARTFYDKHPDETLIVVTADHETGGMAMGNKKMKYKSDIGILKYQKSSYTNFEIISSLFREQLSGNSEQDFESMMQIISNEFGLGYLNKIPLNANDSSLIKEAFLASMYENESYTGLTYGDDDPLMLTILSLMSEKSGIGWTTYSHTAVNVPVYAIGVGAENFSSYIDNTDIPKIIESLME